MFIVV